jgi:HEAT repeat protein
MVLAGALALAAQRPSAALVPALCALARHCDPALRLPVLGILGGFDAPPVREVLLAACVDSVREIRIAAYRQVRGRRLQEAREVLQQVVAAGGYATQDFNERVVLFEALGTVADASTVALLDRLLNARGLMGPKEPSDVRACAARGLARAASAAAREALERADGGRDPLVQRAVRLALDGEGGA